MQPTDVIKNFLDAMLRKETEKTNFNTYWINT